MPPPLNRRQGRLLEQLYRTGNLNTINGAAKELKANPEAIKAHIRQYGYVTNFKRRLMRGLFGVALLGAIAGVVWSAYPRQSRTEVVVSPVMQQKVNSSFTVGLPTQAKDHPILVDDRYIQPEELTLQNAKEKRFDTKFGQAYLNKLLGKGKVTFRSTEVIYDPNSEKAIEFLEGQLHIAEDHLKKDLIRDEIKKAKYSQIILKAYRQQATFTPISQNPPYGIIFAVTYKIPDAPIKVFVFELQPFLTDNDVLSSLEHEWCHAEARREIKNVHIPRGYDPREASGVLISILGMPEVEEGICFSHQLKNAQNASRVSLDTTKWLYIPQYDALVSYRGTELQNLIMRQLVSALINPHKYRPK